MSSMDSISSMLNNNLRINGLASGLDTDSIVKAMLKSEQNKLDKVKQNKQLAEWKRDQYRELTSLIRGMKTSYLDVLSSTNMLSSSTYKQFTASSADSTHVTATGTSSASPGTYSVRITQLATADKAVSATGVTKPLQSSAAVSTGADSDVTNMSGKQIKVTLDGVTREITLGTYTDANTVANVAADIKDKLDAAFGSTLASKFTVEDSGGKLLFNSVNGAGKLTLASGTTDALTYMHIASGTSNRLTVTDTLATINGKLASGMNFATEAVTGRQYIQFSINDKSFKFYSDTTLAGMMRTINADSKANVNMVYDEATDKFSITSKQLGDGDNIRLSQTAGTFFNGASNITTANPFLAGGVQGQDAKVKINGETIVRSSNVITLNGVTYTLNKEHDAVDLTDDTDVTLSMNTDAIYNSIKGFVDKYNEVITKINGKLSEKYDKNYRPLTDEQKDALDADTIKKWEDKAKTGLLRNDSILEGFVNDVRKAVYDPIADVSGTLASIGITTGLYTEKGKLNIDETKLKAAIQSDPDNIMDIFSKKSTSHGTFSRSMSTTDRAERTEEEGIAYRISDIMEDYISTFRDSKGNKGKLLEKAGQIGDASEFKNTILDEIKGYNTKMDNIEDTLYRKETLYYARFSRMESLMSSMNSQGSWIGNQLK